MEKRKMVRRLSDFPPVKKEEIEERWAEIRPLLKGKIVVLDDDPTGVQTVHGVPVYTDWQEDTIKNAFASREQMFFVLTNSRAFTAKETEQVHREIAARVERIAQTFNHSYILISRGDSTLRGHYPLETEVMMETIQQHGGETIDGEIILPFFKEGGRVTVDNIHYVQSGETLVPAGETEFAGDRTFGFKASHLGKWIEEKTEGRYSAEMVTYISLQSLRKLAIDEIAEQLMAITDFQKVVVNAVQEEDVRVFAIALIHAMEKGKRFLFRTAATFTKVIGDISSIPFLQRHDLIKTPVENGGLVLIGSHVQKTTEQLKQLQTVPTLQFIEFNCHLVMDLQAFQEEAERVRLEAQAAVARGMTSVIYTKRERLDLGEGKQEEELKLSVDIANAVTSIVRQFEVRPAYIIAKGGITSSEIGIKGLKVKRATVAGQIAPGVPVWKIGSESKFPHIPYVIFPGNVGTEDTLKEVVLELEAAK